MVKEKKDSQTFQVYLSNDAKEAIRLLEEHGVDIQSALSEFLIGMATEHYGMPTPKRDESKLGRALKVIFYR